MNPIKEGQYLVTELCISAALHIYSPQAVSHKQKNKLHCDAAKGMNKLTLISLVQFHISGDMLIERQ